jgi:arylsulfatase A-like enzyme
MKGSSYEGGVRVPMIARWTGKIKPGSVSHYPWMFQDVLPTLGDLAGIRGIPRNVDGISVAPTLFGNRQDPARPLYWESYGGEGSGGGFHQALRMGKWKAVRHGIDAPLELYNLEADIGESKDVAAANPQVVKSIADYLQDCRTESPEYPSATPRRRRAASA